MKNRLIIVCTLIAVLLAGSAYFYFFKIQKNKVPQEYALAFASSTVVSFPQYDYLTSTGTDKTVDSNGNEITNLTQEQLKDKHNAEIIANKAAPIMRDSIRYLHDSNIEELVKLTDPNVLEKVGKEDVVAKYKEGAEYFKNYKSMNEDEGTISLILDNNGKQTDGIIFQENFLDITGKNKMFSFVFVNVGGKYYINTFLPGETSIISSNTGKKPESKKEVQITAHPSPEFSTQNMSKVRGQILVPKGWFFRHESSQTHESYFVSKEEIVRDEDQFKTGITLLVVGTSIPAQDYANGVVAQYSSAYNFSFSTKVDKGVFTIYEFGFDVKDPDYDYREVVKIYANNKTNTSYVVVFESPVPEWSVEWQKGKKILDGLVLSEKI